MSSPAQLSVRAQNPLRFGLIESELMVIEPIQTLDLQAEFELVALANPHPASRNFGRKTASHPIGRYENVESMLAKTDLDNAFVILDDEGGVRPDGYTGGLVAIEPNQARVSNRRS